MPKPATTATRTTALSNNVMEKLRPTFDVLSQVAGLKNVVAYGPGVCMLDINGTPGIVNMAANTAPGTYPEDAFEALAAKANTHGLRNVELTTSAKEEPMIVFNSGHTRYQVALPEKTPVLDQLVKDGGYESSQVAINARGVACTTAEYITKVDAARADRKLVAKARAKALTS